MFLAEVDDVSDTGDMMTEDEMLKSIVKIKTEVKKLNKMNHGEEKQMFEDKLEINVCRTIKTKSDFVKTNNNL